MGVVYSLIWIGVFAALGFGSYWFIQRQERTRGQQPPPVAPADDRPTPQPGASAVPVDDGPPVALPIELWIKLVDRVAHLAILGPTDSGKTTLAEAVLRMLLERSGDRKTVIIDPKWKQQSPPKWGGLPAAMLDEAGGYTAVERVLQQLLDEFRARVKRLQQGQPLGDDIIIIWDEINDAMEEIGKMAGQILRRGLRIWREYRLKLIIFPQSDLVEALGLSGHGDARQNLLWIYLMEAALEKARELERQKVVDATFVHVLMQQERPAIMVWMKRAFIIDTSAALALAALPIAPERAWHLIEPDERTTNDVRDRSFERTALESPVSDVRTVRSLWSDAEFVQVMALIIANERTTGKKRPPSEMAKRLPRYQADLYGEFKATYEELVLIAQAVLNGTTGDATQTIGEQGQQTFVLTR